MRALFACLVLVLAAAAAPAARADTYVIVHAANPTKALVQKEVTDLYMGRARAFPNGDFALVFDLPRDHAVRDAYYQQLVGMTPAQVNSYWSRLMFTGQTMPPQPLPNEAAVIDMVRRNPSAIGYVGHEPADHGVRVVLTLPSRN